MASTTMYAPFTLSAFHPAIFVTNAAEHPPGRPRNLLDLHCFFDDQIEIGIWFWPSLHRYGDERIHVLNGAGITEIENH
jgi:hypothetical protein